MSYETTARYVDFLINVEKNKNRIHRKTKWKAWNPSNYICFLEKNLAQTSNNQQIKG